MVIIIGFIILIILIGFIASGSFASLAKSKGYAYSKAKKYPGFIAGLAFFFNMLGQTLISFTDKNMHTLLIVGWGCFVILAELAILHKAYKNMQAAPDAG